MKERFGTFDVRAMVHNVSQEILGLRAANIYDINNKTYLIKFSKPGSSPACVWALVVPVTSRACHRFIFFCFLLMFRLIDVKKFLLIESGVRFHTTSYMRDKNDFPSSFSVKVQIGCFERGLCVCVCVCVCVCIRGYVPLCF